MNNISAPMNSVVVSIEVAEGDSVRKDQTLAIVEAMKMQYNVTATLSGVITKLEAEIGDVLEQGDSICWLTAKEVALEEASELPSSEIAADNLQKLRVRIEQTEDSARTSARQKRHAKGYRTARENLAHLVDDGSFTEYGQLCVAAQRSRKSFEALQTETAADGVITGTATVNSELVGAEAAQAAVVINDYSVLAGTQGYFHHHKLDRILELAEQWRLPVVMYTEGGGGRPGDTDVLVSMAGLNVSSFKTWARLSGLVPRIAVNNGYCFAGNAALFGCADVTIATKSSCIGMAGPAMIEGGGLGKFAPTDIGPIEVQTENGVVDLVADDEAHATRLAQQVLSYFQGKVEQWSSNDQSVLRSIVPEKRRSAYQVRDVINAVADNPVDDESAFLELRPTFGAAVVTGFARIAGRSVGIIANDCHFNGGAVDAQSAEKAARFIQLCDAFDLPLVSFTDTPGFMVGPHSEKQAAVRKMASLFVTAASISVPVVAIVLRKGYGLGAMAMTGGSMFAPVHTAAWPSGEFGAMGLEGAVQLGYKKELEAEPEGKARDQLFEKLLGQMVEQGRATEAAMFQEIDAVIDPIDTRDVIIRSLNSAQRKQEGQHQKRRNFVDTR